MPSDSGGGSGSDDAAAAAAEAAAAATTDGEGEPDDGKRTRSEGGNEDGTGEVERRGGGRCAPATVCAGKGGEEVRANDGCAPNSKSEEECTVGARTRGIEY